MHAESLENVSDETTVYRSEINIKMCHVDPYRLSLTVRLHNFLLVLMLIKVICMFQPYLAIFRFSLIVLN